MAMIMANIDKKSPTLVETNPVNKSFSVDISQNIVLTFDEEVKANVGRIQLSNGTDTRSISILDKSQVTFNGENVIINPKANLIQNSHYSVTISQAAIKDLARNKFVGISDDTVFSFDTSDSISDKSAPELRFTSPSNGNKLVAVNRDVSFYFTEKIQLGNGNIVLSDGKNLIKIPVSDSQVTLGNSKLTLNPKLDFDFSKAYTVSLEAGAVKDLAGNAFAGNGFTFYTKASSDKTAPKLTTTLPANNAPNVLTDENLTLTFNEAIKAGKGNLVISNGTDIRTISITDSQVVISGKTLTINPTDDLLAGSRYSVQLEKGAITDLVGNAFAGITDATTFNFQTEAIKLSGKVIDGYIAGATVYVIGSDKKTYTTTTDKNGYFEFSGKNIPPTPTSSFSAMGGKDGANDFTGLLTAPAGSTVISPLTTLQNAFMKANPKSTVNDAEALVLKAIGVSNPTDIENYDPVLALKNKEVGAADLFGSSAKLATLMGAGANALKNSSSGKLSLEQATDLFVGSLVSELQDKQPTSSPFKLTAGGGGALSFDLASLKQYLAAAQTAYIQQLTDSGASAKDIASFNDGMTKQAEQAVQAVAVSAAALDTIIEKINAAIEKGEEIKFDDVLAAISDTQAQATTEDNTPTPEPTPTPTPTPEPPAPTPTPESPAPTPTPEPPAPTPTPESPAPTPPPPPADTTQPTLSSSTPADNATGVAIASDIVLKFSEPVAKGTGNIVITNTIDSDDTRTIAVSDAQVKVSGDTVTINPTADLKSGYDYNVTIASGAIKDSSGNAYAGISDVTTLNFTTVSNGTTANPVLVQTSGNDIIQGNQSSIIGSVISFNAAQGADQYVFSAIRTGTPAALPSANVTITGFDAATGDRLVFDVADTANGLAAINTFYSVSDDGKGKVEIIVNDDGNIQVIELTGLSNTQTIHNMTELSAFLGATTAAIAFI
jgi:methionine-rich copper-binding protein CopC